MSTPHLGIAAELADQLRFGEERRLMVDTVRKFVERDVLPVASRLEHEDRYPHDLIAQMKSLGLFGVTIPQEDGGLGLDFTTYAMLVEELSRGWMSLAGAINSHLLTAYMIEHHGTSEQKATYLPAMATGAVRAALAITEPQAGSDVQAIRTRATRDGADYLLSGSKMFITNAREAQVIATLVKTDVTAQPPHRGISIFLVDKGTPGLSVGRPLGKLGYKGVETCEVAYDGVRVPETSILGAVPGEGFAQVMSALEVGRINVAARAVGVARASLESALSYSVKREAFGKKISEFEAIQMKLADMATKIEAARLLTLAAAAKKDRGERCDLEAGMAKLFATEICQECVLESMRIHGGIGYTTELPVERYYRDAPLLLIGEGTNEIQRLVIARQLLRRLSG
jgi:alkylation response protein AidB-like acyl-CoA dehydrogenase